MSMPDIRPRLTSGLTLAAVPTAAGVARFFVRQRLSQWGLNRLIDDAELVLSELVTNAVIATGTTNPQPKWSELDNLAIITVRLVVTADSLVIEVWDRDPKPPTPKQAKRDDENGRGLAIVTAFCRRWNYFYPESGGKAIWGELVIPSYDLMPSGMPQRQSPRLAPREQADDMPDIATLGRVLEGLHVNGRPVAQVNWRMTPEA
jgi:anti-sigma regulatory factor (Ser/Thr protein kinase)